MSLFSAVVCVRALSATHCARSSTQILGRAKEVREFIKHGKDKATIEIELCNTKGRNVVVQRTILQDNKSQWKLNGHGVGKARVMDVMKKLNVQVDNLCQFLPQDRYAPPWPRLFLGSKTLIASSCVCVVCRVSPLECATLRPSPRPSCCARRKRLWGRRK
jgi:hypothetical protein